MFTRSIKQITSLCTALSLTACVASESAFLHPKLYYPETNPPIDDEADAHKVVVFGQSYASNALGMGTFLSQPHKIGKYYRAFISSTQDIPSVYAECKTPGNSHSGFAYVNGFTPEKKYELGKYYQVSCEKINIKHFRFEIKESNRAIYEQEMAGGLRQQNQLVQNKQGKKNDAESVHFYAPKLANTNAINTKIIDPYSRLRWQDNLGTDLYLKGNASIVQINCIFPKENGSSVVNVTGNCLVPQSSGVLLSEIKETNLWEVYCMAMPRPRLESEKKYKTLKRASQR
jgi:hypothetical protein